MDIKNARFKLELVDKQLKFFFMKRMKIINLIKEIKMKNKINIYDKKREKILSSKLMSKLSYPFNILYQDFLNNIFKISKLYQLINKNINIDSKFSKIVYINKSIKNNLLKKKVYIKVKTFILLINYISKDDDSIGIINYSIINYININEFIQIIINKKLVINILNKNNNNFLLIKRKNKNDI